MLLNCKHLLYQHRINNESINWKCKMAKDKDVKCGCTITSNDYILSCGKKSDRCPELTDFEVDVMGNSFTKNKLKCRPKLPDSISTIKIEGKLRNTLNQIWIFLIF